MKTSTKRGASIAGALVAVGVIVGGSVAFASGVGSPTSDPTPTVTREAAPPDTTVKDALDLQRAAAAQAEAERVQAERAAAEAAAAEAARVAAEEAARVEADRVAAEQNTQQQAPTQQSAPSQPAQSNPQPAAPVRCPAGSVANSNDGYNDTSCFPEICFSIMVPDPAHPECDVAFRP